MFLYGLLMFVWIFKFNARGFFFFTFFSIYNISPFFFLFYISSSNFLHSINAIFFFSISTCVRVCTYMYLGIC
ncbi:hypothetical protein DFH27DRAFT_574195 [Peziza echinospora]|nr:hypothetical protein DFH27DRAFT_574195 [Peziza echinospora]